MNNILKQNIKMIKYDRNFITFITKKTVVYSMERIFYTNKSTETLIRRRYLHLKKSYLFWEGKGGISKIHNFQ